MLISPVANSLLPLSSSLPAAAAKAQGLAAQAADDPAKLATVTKEFESMFTSLLLKEMRQTMNEGGLFAGDSSDVYGSLFDLHMGRVLAASGLLPLAQSLDPTSLDSSKQVEPTERRSAS